MMETKVWIALCALLLFNLGSAENNEGPAPASSSSQSFLPVEPSPEAAHSELPDSLDPNHITNPSSKSNGSLIVNTTTEEEPMINDTNITSSSEADVLEGNGNQTNLTTSQPPIAPSASHAPKSHTPTTSTSTGPTHTTHSTSVVTPTSTPPTTSHSAPAVANSVTASNQTVPSTSVPTPEPPKPEASTTTIIIYSSSMPTTSSSQETPNSESTSRQNTLQPDEHPETPTKPQLETTSNPPSSPTAKAEPLADLPSQLIVGGDTTVVRDSPTLDPLLAGLVSAFIITAVIITLLLFLKLRRRDNRPEFRRLQDLPMDDMMEDTPLSMYSY
ncbi:uncharacterized protein PB18E9.04c isoform X2 [Notothenia coriiceps]|uniref:Uncharacterized protein PB18E9.04c isoform X2 n=1 Tax=Notothenia coriiceps TaxID=8208 RepID=A0A6I9Q5Y4_9TELE|nr:PREDICTED: uncharacterized protein PB18E9.04c-like isoform X2 [Notothenia coriiceps]